VAGRRFVGQRLTAEGELRGLGAGDAFLIDS
jgi:hypothetical protein